MAAPVARVASAAMVARGGPVVVSEERKERCMDSADLHLLARVVLVVA